MKLEQLEKHMWVFETLIDEDIEQQFDEALDYLSQGSLLASELTLTRLLSEYPQHIDAWVHLGLVYEYSGRKMESYLALREAHRIGLAAFSTTFNWDKDLLEWGFIENRPFLRACFNLALHLADTPMAVEAEQIFTRLVKISPNDNQGARYLLLKRFLETGNKLKLQWLDTKYPEDHSPEFLYGKVLFALMQQDMDRAKATFFEAKAAFPLVARELKKKRHPKPAEFEEGYITMGGKDQAFVYWREFGHLWEYGSPTHEFLLANI